MSATIIPPTIGVATTRTTRSRRIPATLLALAPAVLALLVAAPAPASASAALGPPPARPPAAAASVAQAPPVAVPVALASGGGSHTVLPGETLSGIALQHGTTVSALVAANGLSDPDFVRDGTTLTLPSGGSAAVGTAPAGSAPAPTGGASTGNLPERLRESPSRQALIPVFDRWANANGVPADLLKAMTWLESGWQNGVVSHTNAVGIGQLMPDTVDFMEDLIGADLDPAVPEDNIRMSARYLRWLLGRYGTAADALAAYYQGPSSVERNGTFDETDTYVANVLALRARF